jgi:cytochrome P450
VFEEAIPHFLMSLFPSITIPRSYKARQHLQQAFSEYYAAGYYALDPTTATVTFNRANTLAEYGFTGDEIGLMECILPAVSTLNAVPTLFWLLLHILPDVFLVEELREEIAASVEISGSDSTGGRVVTFDISKFETELTLLVSCYRETLRLANHVICNRRVMQDMTLQDQDGRTYLLKKGVDIQLPGGVTHRDNATWGPDAARFRADRFLASTSKITDADRTRRAAYMPFGGGRHLCPGRNFAFAEIIGCAAVMLLGFDIEATGMKFEEMEVQGPRLSSATVKPANSGQGLGARMKPRDGFENVSWEFRV